MRDERETGRAMFIKRPFSKIQDLFEGIKEWILRHINNSHIFFGNIKLRSDRTVRTARGTDTSSGSRNRSRGIRFAEWEWKHA
jgi:hypothetical protein